jgi:predicted ATPase
VTRDLPSGIVTFLFTDVEGSTKLLHELGADAYSAALLEHRRILRDTFTRHGGVEVDTQGDAFFVAFPTGRGAVDAACEAQDALLSGPIRVRIGIHTGTPNLSQEGYVGHDVHLGARIAGAGHGGQVLLSKETRELADVEATDLGEHRLKDFDEAVSIFQLGSERFPPLKTISNTNLPRPASSFVGRDSEVEDVVSQLRNGTRLLTLTGPGGSGKTRLAIEAAATLVPEFKAGVFWVGLATLRDSALVTETIAHTLGAKDGLANHIGEREQLLLLDNLEQVVGAADELAALLEACPNLKLLVTSRELLRVRGEVDYPVLPLAEPEAVELFCARARLEPDDAVHELCRALDNLPLALELAAARASVLSPKQMLERLSKRLDLFKGGRDADPRQQTLRATIAWSHELLSYEEQQLFARLAVFAGGCTLEAAEEVLEAQLDTLQSLVDKSLLRPAAERFWMLETIREYAAERLCDSGEAEFFEARHLRYFLELAEQAYAERDLSPTRWIPVLEAEHDNLRAALDRAREHSPAGEAQLAGAVAMYWSLRGRDAEARERLRGAVARYRTADATRARALTHLGEVENDVDTALRHLDEAVEAWRSLADPVGEAIAFEAIGWAYDQAGNYPAAQRAQEKSLELRHAANAPPLEGARSLAGLCHVLVATGATERAEQEARELLELAQEHGAPRMEQIALHFLADCPLVTGDYDEAERRYVRALKFARAAGLLVRCIDEVVGIAMSAAGKGDPARAVRLAAAAARQREELHLTDDEWWSRMQTWFIEGARAQLTEEERDGAESAGRSVDFDKVLGELAP